MPSPERARPGTRGRLSEANRRLTDRFARAHFSRVAFFDCSKSPRREVCSIRVQSNMRSRGIRRSACFVLRFLHQGTSPIVDRASTNWITFLA